MVHGALAIPDRTDRDEVVITKEEIEATGLDYLALGHWHSSQKGKAGATTYAYSGAPEPVAVDQDGAGNVVIVTLEEAAGQHVVKLEERRVGRTRFERLDIDAARLKGQPDLIARLSAKADPDLVLETRLTGVRPDELDVDTGRGRGPAQGLVHARPGPRRVDAGPQRGRDPLAPTRSPARSSATSRHGSPSWRRTRAMRPTTEAAELRDVLRLGRLLLAGHEVSL